MTAEEFLKLCTRPENSDRLFELLRGDVIECPLPSVKHGVVCATVGCSLSEYERVARNGYVVGANCGILLRRHPDTVLGPDIAYYADTTPCEDVPGRWNHRPPVLAVEVLSENHDYGLTVAKVEEYLTNGVRLVWLADPYNKSVTVYRAGRPAELLSGDTELTGGEELPGYASEVADFFRLPAERAARRLPAPPAA